MGVLMWIWRVLIVTFVGIAQNDAAKWSYVGDAGPLFWHEIFPKACSGKHQSPIDIRPEETVYDPNLKDFAIYYDPPKPDSKMYIRNNGHTVQIDLHGDFYVTNGGLNNVYKALQFHFHWGHTQHHGSEHTFNNEPSPIEMHLVTYNQELFTDIGEAVVTQGGLAVLGTMYEISKDDNPSLATIIRAIKHVKDPVEHEKVEIPLMSLREILPKDTSRYYRYNGSLTTPGCFESVIWTVFDEKQTISQTQLNEFTKILQQKHYHGKHHKEAGSRHRRSLNKAEKQMEHRAERVLDELGIRGNGFEEAVLMSEVMQMVSDMPQDDGEVVKEITKDSEEHKQKEKGDSENDDNDTKEKNEEDKTEDDHKKDEDVKDDGDHGTDEGGDVKEKEHTEDHATEEKVITEETHEEEYTQDVMVNNFRPVQPLNDRIVYRSFKSKAPSINLIMEDDSEVIESLRSTSVDDNNRATYHLLSLPTILTLSVITLIFV